MQQLSSTVGTLPISAPEIAQDPSWSIPWRRLLPLWRHLVWLLALFTVAAVAVWVHLDVQRLHIDLDRNDRLQRQSQVLNERLHLEQDARRRLLALEAMGQQLAVGPHARIVAVGVATE